METPGFRIPFPTEKHCQIILDDFLKEHKDNDGIFYFFSNVSLPKPLEKFTCRMYGGEKSYQNFSEIYYNEHTKDSLDNVLGSAKDRLSNKYLVDGFPLNFTVRDDEVSYNVMTGNDYLDRTDISSRGLPKKSDFDNLMMDLPVFFEITSTVVNSFYESPGKNINMMLEPSYPNYKVVFIAPKKKQDKEKKKIEIPAVTFDEIGGCEEAKKELKRISYLLDNPEKSWEWDIFPPKGIILYGPPGTGKTLLAKATAKEINASFYPVKITDITEKWYGMAEKNMADVFENARQSKPSIIFFDELDSLAMERDKSHEATARVVATMLNEMDGIESSSGVIAMGATNRLHSIDPALLRAGRFEKKIEVPLPDKRALGEIYSIKLRGRRVGEEIEISKLVEKSEGFSGADVDFVVRQSAEMKIDEAIEGKTPRPLSTEDLLKSIWIYKENLEKTTGKNVQDPLRSYQ